MVSKKRENQGSNNSGVTHCLTLYKNRNTSLCVNYGQNTPICLSKANRRLEKKGQLRQISLKKTCIQFHKITQKYIFQLHLDAFVFKSNLSCDKTEL